MIGNKRVAVIVPGAGEGKRMSAGSTSKPFLILAGEPVIARTIRRLAESAVVDDIVVVLREADVGLLSPAVVPGSVGSTRPAKVRAVVPGGRTRQESVIKGLEAVRHLRPDIVVVHDAVRPLVTPALMEAVIAAAARDGAATAAVRPKDTVRIQEDPRGGGSTPDRSACWLVQTPQAFGFGILDAALAAAVRSGHEATDDASLVERNGAPVTIVPGEYGNIKITTPEDLHLAEVLEGRVPENTPGS